ncbi:MucB/RseB C-terminal domain-containing protein [Thalassotalea sp. PS06]|uniref:MucB/RseB C-terminal domain-containing protein n=1 Tax=Thalassotalea sp. PS06 TaxID=2594005 RepID=UPI001163A6D8|nr:MucB/RseB C-terminal domain-containing protein [Thalassotalea sp. PS06]QDP02016.1 transcriptional regulator [Thalassotalea sp. PS06]
MKSALFILLSAAISLPVLAQQSDEAKAPEASTTQPAEAEGPLQMQQPTAKQWLQRLSTSLRELNFDTSFVVVRNNRAEPYRWLHGVENGRELELISLLNGPRKEAVRVDNTVSYFESNQQPYSVNTDSISGPIPRAFTSDIDKIYQSYDLVEVGKSRILGRPAQLIRLVSKDKQRFGYWIWLDIESGLLLKAAIINNEGELLEQIQFTHLTISENSNEMLKQLLEAELPETHESPSEVTQAQLSWRVNWLPKGFDMLESNQHYVEPINLPVDFLLFNDGLVDVSVYVSATEEAPRKSSVNQTGATVLLSQIREGYEITVVGKVPAQTADAIADSITFN